MKKFGDNEENIEESLKNMPTVKDHLDKDQLFQRISSEVNKRKLVSRKKRFAFVPIFSAVAAIGLLLLLVPLLINETMVQDDSKSSSDHAMDTNVADESAEYREESGSAAENDKHQEELALMDQKSASNVIPESKNHETIVHGAVTDSQGQYIIPLSLVASDTADKSQYYNEFGDYLDEENWGLSHYMFSEADFQLNETSQQVHIDLPEDFSPVGRGSAGPSLFEDLLAAMFVPIQVDSVSFNESISLGQIGKVEELHLQPGKNIYKSYQAVDADKEFLVQVPIDEQADFETALSEMKIDEEMYHVTGTVPESADFSVHENGSELHIEFADPNMLSAEQALITMIDAILMTAKSFGYNEVAFSNAPQSKTGPYDLSSPVQVPEGANPIIPE